MTIRASIALLSVCGLAAGTAAAQTEGSAPQEESAARLVQQEREERLEREALVRKALVVKEASPAALAAGPQPASADCPIAPARYVELIAGRVLPELPNPWGPGYPVAFDETIDTGCYSKIRVFVQLFAIDFENNAFTPAAGLHLRFMHQFGGGNSFDYSEGEIPHSEGSSIHGFVEKPIIGDRLRLVASPTPGFVLPPGPFRLHVTCYLVR